jgi:hypothetical protein
MLVFIIEFLVIVDICQIWLSQNKLVISTTKFKFVMMKCSFMSSYVTTLVLGSRPRQGLAKMRAKSEAHELDFMLSGM